MLSYSYKHTLLLIHKQTHMDTDTYTRTNTHTWTQTHRHTHTLSVYTLLQLCSWVLYVFHMIFYTCPPHHAAYQKIHTHTYTHTHPHTLTLKSLSTTPLTRMHVHPTHTVHTMLGGEIHHYGREFLGDPVYIALHRSHYWAGVDLANNAGLKLYYVPMFHVPLSRLHSATTRRT